MPIRRQTTSQLAVPPRGILFAPPKHGKTTLLAECFPSWRWYMTEPTVLARAESNGIALPRDRFVLDDEFTLEGGDRTTSETYWDRWFLREHEKMGALWTKAREAGKKRPCPGYVLSDASTFFDWVSRDVDAKVSGKGRGMFIRIARKKLLISKALQLSQANEFGFVWEMHRAEIAYEEATTPDGSDNPRAGEVKWPAGPRFPVGSMRELAGRSLDFIWEVVIEDGTQILINHPVPNTVGGVRRQMPDRIPLTNGVTLRDVMIEAKFKLPPLIK